MFNRLEALIFDFDGVLTDDHVWVDQSGTEMVCCNRWDGLAFDVLRKQGINIYILSTETNPVVLKRGQKIKIEVHQGSKNKLTSLVQLAESQAFSLKNTFYTWKCFKARRPTQFLVDSKAYNIIENTHQIWLLMVCDLIIGKAEYPA